MKANQSFIDDLIGRVEENPMKVFSEYLDENFEWHPVIGRVNDVESVWESTETLIQLQMWFHMIRNRPSLPFGFPPKDLPKVMSPGGAVIVEHTEAQTQWKMQFNWVSIEELKKRPAYALLADTDGKYIKERKALTDFIEEIPIVVDDLRNQRIITMLKSN